MFILLITIKLLLPKLVDTKAIEVLKKTNSHVLISLRKRVKSLSLAFMILKFGKASSKLPWQTLFNSASTPANDAKGKNKRGEKQVPRIHINKIYPRKFKAMNRGNSKKYKPQLSTYANRSIVTWQPLKRTPSFLNIYLPQINIGGFLPPITENNA